MFDNFSGKITKIFDQISRKKTITEDDLNSSMREIRIALIEADVSLLVIKDFIEKVKAKAINQNVIKSVSASQMIVKIVSDQLTELLGGEKSELNFKTKSPLIILNVGLQGAGKTTSSAKLAVRLKNKNHKKILLASLDVYRPAAQKQLEILAKQNAVDVVEIIENQSPVEIALRAKKQAIDQFYDVLILDSAGRTSINEEMMNELVEIKNQLNPQEILLVVDAMIGQDAVNVATKFNEKLSITGIILTRLDGDSRGGAALSVKSVTNCDIKFIGVGEKIDEFEEFNPDRIASRIIGMGDVVSLVEKAQEVFDAREMEIAAKKMLKNKFDFDDLLSQIRNMRKIGGLSSIVNYLPGMAKIKEQLGEMKEMELEIKRQEAIILSMTKKERAKPEILNSSRKFRIAAGAGSNIQEVNRLMKKYKQMQKMMIKLGKIDPKKLQEMANNHSIN